MPASPTLQRAPAPAPDPTPTLTPLQLAMAEAALSGKICACGLQDSSGDCSCCNGCIPCIFPIALMGFFIGFMYVTDGFGCAAGRRPEDVSDADYCMSDPVAYVAIGFIGLLFGIVIVTCNSKQTMPSIWRFCWDVGCCLRCPSAIQFAVRAGIGRGPYVVHPSDASHGTRQPAPVAPPPLKPHASDERLIQIADTMLSSMADTHAECCICIEPLHAEPLATLTFNRRNACAHFLHARCADELLGSETTSWAGEAVSRPTKNCPICRAEFNGIVRVPALSEDVDGWFWSVDVEGDGRLSRQQVLNVLVAQFPIDTSKLDEVLPTLWERWDMDGTGYVSKDEFLHPEQGLMRFVRTTLLRENVEDEAHRV